METTELERAAEIENERTSESSHTYHGAVDSLTYKLTRAPAQDQLAKDPFGRLPSSTRAVGNQSWR